MEKTFVIGSDFAGYQLKTALKEHLQELGYQVEDYGCVSEDDQTHYPYIAKRVCDRIIESGYRKLGMLICGTGVGMAISANKCRGIRAVVAQDIFATARSRESNHANVICMGQGVTGLNSAKKLLELWISLGYDPSADERVSAIEDVENMTMK